MWLVLKVGILILLGIFIYDSLANHEELSWDSFSSAILNSKLFSLPSILILFLLTFANWFLEISKWKLLGKQVENLSFKQASVQSLASLSFSLLTPNRIGEYGAKALYYQKEDRKKIVMLNFIGNFHQLLVTLILGCFGIFFTDTFTEYGFSKQVQLFVQLLPIGIVLILIALNFNRKYREWRKRFWNRFDYITKKLNAKIFLLSLLRYLVFAHQFYYLTVIFNLNLPYDAALAAITTVYLFASIIPMLSLFDFVLKGSVAVVVFSTLGVFPSIILSITTIMWVLNFVFPSVLGSYFVLSFKPVSSR